MIRHFHALALPLLMLLVSICQAGALASKCQPRPKQTFDCDNSAVCDGILRKAYTIGCRDKKGKLLLDGGCQCQGYCGYTCAPACQADPECNWSVKKRKCFNTATGLVGKKIPVCTATKNPTLAPTTRPTKSPTRSEAPTTTQPTISPTESYCRRDGNFPGSPLVAKDSQLLASSSNGNKVLVYQIRYINLGQYNHSIGEYEGGTLYDHSIWVTRKTAATGKWKPQLVEKYMIADDYEESINVQSGAMSADGRHLVLSTYFNLEDGFNLTFYSFNSNGNVKRNMQFTFPENLSRLGYYPGPVWMNDEGDKALIYFYIMMQGADQPEPKPRTVNLERVNGKWSIEWTQDNLRLQSVSRNGKSALSLYRQRQIYTREGKQWVLESPDLVGTGTELPRAEYQGSIYNRFSSNGNAFVLGTRLADEFNNPQDSGAWVFVRSANGTWTQMGNKLGGGRRMLFDGVCTGISSDLKTVMLSIERSPAEGSPAGFKLFRQNQVGDAITWEQVGEKVITSANIGHTLSANGKVVITNLPASVWNC